MPQGATCLHAAVMQGIIRFSTCSSIHSAISATHSNLWQIKQC